MENNLKNPKERLINTAIEMIYELGFDATSVNHLIEASGTHKASFYRYFENKEEVGDMYLKLQGENFLKGWKFLMEKSKSPEDFVRVWVSLLKRQIRKKTYFGCPIARFMSSSEKSQTSSQLAREIIREWTDTLGDYFFTFEKKEKSHAEDLIKKNECYEKGKKFLKIFQGNSQMFVITGELSYIDEMEKEMLDLLNE